MHTQIGWQYLLFGVPLLFGLLLVLGAAVGVVSADLDLDLDADANTAPDVDAEPDVEADAGLTEGAPDDAQTGAGPGSSSWPGIFGVGRVPLAIVLMSFSMLFGGFGLATLFLLGSWLGTGWIGTCAVAIVSLITALLLTSLLTAQLSRVLPATETYAMPASELLGELGRVELEVSRDFGVVNVASRDKALLKVRAISSGMPIAKGEQVLLVDFDPARGIYLVEPSPFDEPCGGSSG